MAFDPPIPGQTPLEDISGLRDRTIRTQAQLNAAEAENIRRAFVKYLAGVPSKRAARFDLAWAKRLHKEMFGEVWEWAGEFRTADLNIGVPSHQVAIALQSLLGDVRAWSEFAMPVVEQGARMHHRAVFIHPFRNGNGRWARLLANIWVKLNGGVVVAWPESTIGANSTIRGEYLDAIRAADTENYAPLIEMHAKYSVE